MPYVQYDHAGKIVGLYSSPQPQPDGTCLTEPEPLLDDHPEVVAFRAAHPSPEFPKPTLKEIEQSRLMMEKLEQDSKKLNNLMLHHFQHWADLETALSLLLQEVLNIPQPGINIARAIYFSLGGFDARTTVTTKALKQFIHDHVAADKKSNQQLETLQTLWGKSKNYMQQARVARNNVAHGHVCFLPHGGTYHARVSSPFFDPIKQINLIAKGTLPGMGEEELLAALELTRKLISFVDRMNEAVRAFHQFGPQTLPGTIVRLETNLRSLENQ